MAAGKYLLTEDDFREVVDADGNPAGSVPSHWGEDQLAEGVVFKKGTARRGGASTKTQDEPTES